MERFPKDQCYIHAGYSKQTIYSSTYSLQDWYTNGIDARQVILLRDCLPYKIRLLLSKSNLPGKSAIASTGIAKGANCFLTAFWKGTPGDWRKGTSPFLLSAKMDFELWINLSREEKQIEFCFFSIPVSHHDGGVVSIWQ